VALYLNTYLMLKKHLVPRLAPGATLLEVGPGTKFWRGALHRLAEENAWKYHSCDLMNYNPTAPGFVGQTGENDIDSPNDSFDAVACTQTIEHVTRPWLWVPELARVCRPGGLVAITSPVTYAVHSRRRCCPFDGWRILPAGMRRLLEDAGLEVLVSCHERLDPTPDGHHFNDITAPHWDTIGIGRK
jgi:SAM-dependent methyltransferase